MANKLKLEQLEELTPNELGRFLFNEVVYKTKVDVQYVKNLINAGADLEVRDREGWTPLHWAAEQGLIVIVELLLAAGASKEAQTYDGWTPWYLATAMIIRECPKLNPNYNG